MQPRATDGRAKDGKKCPVCDGEVPPSLGYRPRIYCSEACRSHDKYRKMVAARNRSCPGCGVPMPAIRRPGRPPSPWCSDCRLAASTKACARCGVAFAGRRGSKYCSSACRKKPSTTPRKVKCLECGVTFETDGAEKKFCGFLCSQAANSRRLRERNKAVAAPPKSCLCCNKPFYKRSSGRNAGKYCSRECAFEARRLKLPCTQLGRRKGTPLSSHLAVWFHNWGNDLADPVEQGSRVGGHKARCRQYGCHYEPFPDWTIFERDGWECQVCGVALLPEWTNIPGTTTPDPRSPEIDHVIPLSLGADSPGHRPSNVQACCRKCNSKKGSRLLCPA